MRPPIGALVCVCIEFLNPQDSRRRPLRTSKLLARIFGQADRVSSYKLWFVGIFLTDALKGDGSIAISVTTKQIGKLWRWISRTGQAGWKIVVQLCASPHDQRHVH